MAARIGTVNLLIALPRAPEDLSAHFMSLLARLHLATAPALAMLFDLENAHDAEIIFQGLGSLRQVPTYLFIDSDAVAALGRESVKSAPCEVREAPGGGLLVISRADPWARRSGQELRRGKAVEHHFGISREKPLVLG